MSFKSKDTKSLGYERRREGAIRELEGQEFSVEARLKTSSTEA